MIDFDGVVVDSLDAFAAALAAACEERGIAVVRSADDVVDLLNGNVYESFRAAGVDEQGAVQLMAAAIRTLERDLSRLRPFPGVAEAMARLGGRFDVVIVTSNSERLVHGFLAEHGITGVAAVAGVESGVSKVEKIAAVVRRYPAQRVFPFVADTAGDMREARAAGATPIGVGWGWHDAGHLRAAGADRVVASPEELLELLEPSRRDG
ncbi:MAG: HAD hydrolase-like protein [Thermoleophilia bacterium]|jgi:phosphoglycolate phosphatase|nr:HAD hydrolase-like protein [Thermoleophilia bacterium]